MSVKAMSAVWDMPIKDAAAKFVLLAYADHADHKGGSIYPAVSTIAEKTGYDERSVRRITHRLIEGGYLVPQGKSGKGTIRYRIDLTLSQVTESQPDPECHSDLTLDTKTPDPESANPSLTINEPSMASDDAANFLAPMASPTTTVADATKPESTDPHSTTYGKSHDLFCLPGKNSNERLLYRLTESGPEIEMVQAFLKLLPLKLSESLAKTCLSAAREILASDGTVTDMQKAWRNSKGSNGHRSFPVVDLYSLKSTTIALAAERKSKTVVSTATYEPQYN